MRRLWLVIAAVGFFVLCFLATSGRFLVINNPAHAEAILVLAGETDKRPERAVELLGQHYAPRIILDVPNGARIYSRTTLQLAQEYVAQLPARNSITICPIAALSTRGESHDAAKCLQAANARDVLLVTSDFHTRRALSTFSHELPEYHFSVAAAYDPQQFGTSWWRHRQWAKTNLAEWTRLAWWESIDRWR